MSTAPSFLVEALPPGMVKPPTRVHVLDRLPDELLPRGPGDGHLLIGERADRPLLDEIPRAHDRTHLAADGTSYFLPVAQIAERPRRRGVPAVYLDKTDDGLLLRITLLLRRHPAVAADARPLPVDLEVVLGASMGIVFQSVRLDDLRDEPLPPEPGVIRRITARARVDDGWVFRLRSDRTTALSVEGRPAVRFTERALFRFPVAVPPLFGLGSGQVEDLLDGLLLRYVQKFPFDPAGDGSATTQDPPPGTVVSQYDVVAVSYPSIMGPMDDRLEGPNAPIDFSRLLDPSEARVWLGPDGAIPAHFPADVPDHRPIYAAVDGPAAPGEEGVWRVGAAGPWKASSIPNEYFTLPTEYRLAFDVETGLPAVTVLLLEPAPDAPASDYRVRVRFALVPWFDPVVLDDLRTTIAEMEGVVHPEIVVGGYAGATFDFPPLLADLGGDVLGGGTRPVDGRGFELVLDCSMSFYTLLCGLLAPPTGPPTVIETAVRFTLGATSDGATPLHDVPVRIRLDRPADDVLDVEQLPFPPQATWPPGWAPPVLATVRNRARCDVRVQDVVAALLVGVDDQPLDYALPARVDRHPFVVPPADAQAAPPAVPTSLPPGVPPPPDPGPGGVVLGFAPVEPVDVGAVRAIAVDFSGVVLVQQPGAVLDQVHELAASTAHPTSIRVRSFQLANPASLPPALADLHGMEVQVRCGRARPVTVFLTREEHDKVVHLRLLIGDLVAGVDPQQPTFEWRRRNMAGAGVGEFSAWEELTGRDLFVTPVLPA